MYLKDEIPFKDILKPLRGKKYMLCKKAINNIQRHLDLDYPYCILLDERYFTLKHRNSRRLYKLFLFLSKPSYIPFISFNLSKIPVYRYHSINKQILNPAFKELYDVYGIRFHLLNTGVSNNYKFELKAERIVINDN